MTKGCGEVLLVDTYARLISRGLGGLFISLLRNTFVRREFFSGLTSKAP